MNSFEKNARIVWRMKSVDATRVIPSRCATSAASVDLPVPVEPPIRTMIGTSSDCRSASRRSRPTARSPSSSPSVSCGEDAQALGVDGALAAFGEVDLDASRELVGAVGGDADRDQRPRHHALSSTAGRLFPSGSGSPRRRWLIRRPARGQAPGVPRRDRRRRRRSPRARRACHARVGVLGDDVDRGCLELDQVRVGLHPFELAPQRLPVGEAGRDVHDVGVEVTHIGRAGREDGDPALERRRRAQPQLGAKRAGRVAADREHDVGDQPPIGVQVRVRLRPRTDDEHATIDRRSVGSPRRCRRRRRRRAGAPQRARAPAATFEVNTAPASPPPARRQPIVGTPQSAAISRWSEAACRPAPRESDELLDGRRRLHHLRLRRAAAPHRDHDHVAVAREQPREVRGHSRLADALACADDGDRRQLERLERRRLEAKVGTDVRQPGRERPRRPAEPLGRTEHRLVGEVDDDLGARRNRRRAARRSRHPAAASRSRRRGSRRPTRTAGLPARRARPGRSAPRRSAPPPLIVWSSPHARSGRCTSRTRPLRCRTG